MRRHLLKAFAVLLAASGGVLVWRAMESASITVFAQANAVLTNQAPSRNAATNSAAAWSLMEEYFAALAKNQLPKASGIAPKLMTQGTNDAAAMNFLSWRIFADRNIKHRDRGLALAAAERALQLSGGKDATVLDTYARALWENGRRAEAIDHQRKAVQLCTVEAKRIDMEANLNRYVRLSKQAQR